MTKTTNAEGERKISELGHIENKVILTEVFKRNFTPA